MHLDFNDLKPWTTNESVKSFNISDRARMSEKNPSTVALGIKSPSWLLGNGWKKPTIIQLYSSSVFLLQLNVSFAWKTRIIKIASTDYFPPF